MKEIRQAVLDAARKLMTKNNNVLSNDVVSEMKECITETMDELMKDGYFTFKDTKLGRVYSDPLKVKITKSKALKLMQGNKGHFFTATFIKKDGSKRVMNCQYISDQDIKDNYIKVKDMKLIKKDPSNCIRNINLNTLSELSIKGKLNKVK